MPGDQWGLEGREHGDDLVGFWFPDKYDIRQHTRTQIASYPATKWTVVLGQPFLNAPDALRLERRDKVGLFVYEGGDPRERRGIRSSKGRHS